MIIKTRYKKQIKCILLLSIILTSLLSALILPFIPTNSPDVINNNLEDLGETDNNDTPIAEPKSSALGNHTWWDKSYRYRRIINVTNPYSVKFTDFGVDMTFNYEAFGDKIEDDLSDIRIVEYFNDVPVPRNYYVVQDYPSTGYATVWFDNNITNGPDISELDTYMYFGNPAAENSEARDVSESFGWVKNGDFEYDTSTDTKFIPDGWNFTDEPVDYVMSEVVSDTSIDYARNSTFYPDPAESYNNFVFHVTDEVASKQAVGNGDWAYKFGSPSTSVPNSDSLDYVGTLYSYPFKVPTIEGGDILLKLWRNARTNIFAKHRTGQPKIDHDGYFIRICNGSSSVYSSDVDAHQDIGSTYVEGGETIYDNYIDAYGGLSYWTSKWEDPFRLQRHPPGVTSDKYDTNSGELTGYREINVTQYMGQEIFIELGSWGREDGDNEYDIRSAFFQLDDVKFNYSLSGVLDETQAVDNQVTIVAVDVDGRIVPNVEVFIVNNSATGQANFIVNSSTAIDGTKTFTHVPRGRFNITANYTLASGQTVEVFNSSESGEGPYYFNGINYTVKIELDIWTIDFEIVDWDGIPLPYGYIEMNESKGSGWLQYVTLDENGKATFRWLNAPSYYYKIWYDNDDYYSNPTALNESYVYRSGYIPDNIKYTHHTINVNETHTGSYSVSERIYTDYSSNIENKKINSANITLTNMDNYLSDISIYYIDEDNETTGNLIYYEEYVPADLIKDDIIELDIALITSDNIRTDNFEAYGLLIEVNGFNATYCDGIIQVDLIETCNEYNRTALARLDITTVYWNDVSKELEELSAFVRVNTTGIESLVNLSSTADAIPPAVDGLAYGIINQVPLWYLIGQTYNFTIDVANLTSVDFNVNKTSDPTQWRPVDNDKVKRYNFTLKEGSYLTFKIIPELGFNFTDFDTRLNATFATDSVYWGEQIFIWAIFLSTDDNWDTNSIVEDPPGSCSVVITLQGSDTVLYNLEMQYSGSNGNYTLLFNSNKLSAGYSSENYVFEIRGYHPTYDDPTAVPEYVEIKSIPTGKGIHDYEDNYALEADESFEVIYEEFLNISVRYYILENNILLDNATLSYSWKGLGLPSKPINVDPANPDYFTFLLDSGDAPSIGLREIEITCLLENYSLQVFDINIYVDARPTLLNGKDNPLSVEWEVYVKDARNYEFTYIDADTGDKLDNAFDYSYDWYVGGVKVDDGNLIKNVDETYTLDFDTEKRAVGNYIIKVELEQENYEDQDLEIRLEIKLRTFDADLDADNYEDDQVTVVHGEKIKLELTLIDESRGIPLSGATVKLDIGGKKYEFDDDGNGDYTLTYETDDLDAFFTSKTMTGEITIKKVDFVSDEIDITFVVTMEEVFDGMPTFYFIMIVSAISAIVGSLVGYRVIQQARIPKHVKKILLIKKKIKARDSIPSISILTKEQMIMKQFSGAWKDLDLALEDTLGIKEVKSKIPAEGKGPLKQKGGDV